MKDYETISLDISEFDSEDQFWKAVSVLLEVLTKAGYEIKFKYEDCGIYVVEFNHAAHKAYGNATCEWITPEELECVQLSRDYAEEEETTEY